MKSIMTVLFLCTTVCLVAQKTELTFDVASNGVRYEPGEANLMKIALPLNGTLYMKVNNPTAKRFRVVVDDANGEFSRFSEADFSGGKGVELKRNNKAPDGDFRILFSNGVDKTFTLNTKSIVSQDPSVSSEPYQAGIPYYDAKALLERKIFQNDFKSIMRYYLNKPDADDADILALINTNPFLKNIINPEDYSSRSRLEAFDAPVGFSSVSLSSIGGMDVTNFADGLARFFVERTKAELNVAFFDQFNKFLKSQQDFAALFPATKAILLMASSEIYDYQKYLPALREAFEKDLSSLIQNTDKWLGTDPAKATALLNKLQSEPVYPYIVVSVRIAAQIQSGTHPGDILTMVKDMKEVKKIDPDFQAALQTVDLLSQSLRSKSTDRYWITESEFAAFKNETFTRVFIGLVYEKSKSPVITFSGPHTLDKIIAQYSTNIVQMSNLITIMKKDIISIESNLDVIRNSDKPSISSYFDLSRSILKITEDFVNSKVITFPDGYSVLLDSIDVYSLHASNLFADVKAKSYNSAVYELAYFVSKIGGTTAAPFTKGVLKYGTFIASVASAKDPTDVENALEAVALPVGSARVKRESRVNISLNGYVGLFAGYEYIPKTNSPWAGTAGVFAPLGVAFSIGGRKCSTDPNVGGKSYTLFASLIDVGALAAFRFNDSDSKVASEVQLKNIVAPGLFFIWGLGKSPVSLGFGAQMGPMLRDVNPSTLSYADDYYIRTHAFVAIDIPVLNFYTRKDRLK